MATKAAIPPKTPTTIPAIAPPDIPLDLLLSSSAGGADSEGVAELDGTVDFVTNTVSWEESVTVSRSEDVDDVSLLSCDVSVDVASVDVWVAVVEMLVVECVVLDFVDEVEELASELIPSSSPI